MIILQKDKFFVILRQMIKKSYKISDVELIRGLKKGKIAVIPTDTLYGMVASAFRKNAIEKIYRIQKRDRKKPCIILISNLEALKIFGIKPNKKAKEILAKIWPGKVSVILPCENKKFAYLHRGTKTLAFRFPKKRNLLALLKKTGPLIAPSANPENKKPAETIAEAKKYFSGAVDFYADGERLTSKPSTLISLRDGLIEVKRSGAVKIKKV